MLLNDAGPSTPVEITGLTAVPEAGDEPLLTSVWPVSCEAALPLPRKVLLLQKVTLDNLFSQMAQNDMKELAIVVKADVRGLRRGPSSRAWEDLQ